MKRYSINNTNKKTVLQRIRLGCKIGWNIHSSPIRIIKSRNNLLIKIIRLGSYCFLFIRTGIISPSNSFIYFLLFFSIIYLVYQILIFFQRFFHMYKLLKDDKKLSTECFYPKKDRIVVVSIKITFLFKSILDQIPMIMLGLIIGKCIYQTLEDTGYICLFNLF